MFELFLSDDVESICTFETIFVISGFGEIASFANIGGLRLQGVAELL